MKIAMHPHRLACPLRCRQCRFPYLQDRGDTATVLQYFSRCCDVVSVSGERDTAERMDGAAGRVDRLQRCDKPCEARCRPVHVGDTGADRRAARQPGAHSPVPWIALARHAVAERNRDCQRQPWGENRKPLMLVPDVLSADPTTWQPDGQIGSQPEDHVVPAGRLHGRDNQARPLRKLRCHQAADDGNIDLMFGGRSDTASQGKALQADDETPCPPRALRTGESRPQTGSRGQ